MGSTAKKQTPSQNLDLGKVVESLEVWGVFRASKQTSAWGFPDTYTKCGEIKSLAMLSGSLWGPGHLRPCPLSLNCFEAELIGWLQQAEKVKCGRQHKSITATSNAVRLWDLFHG